VAEILTGVGGITDLASIQAALLHDTVEDTNTTPEQLAEHFGDEVMRLVMEVTDDQKLKKDERKALQIDHARDLSTKAKGIKMADKIANVTDIMDSPPVDWDEARRLEYLDWGEKVVAGCRDANQRLAERFDELVTAARSAVLDPPGA